jgi:hypothetical protein
VTRPSPLQRRRAAAVGVSLGVHAAVLLALSQVAPRLVAVPRLAAPPEPPAVELELTARPSGAAAPSVPRPAASQAHSAPSSLHQATAGASQPLPPRGTTGSQARTAIPTPSPADAAVAATARTATATPQGDGRWRVRGEGGDADAAARALARGTVGCDHDGWLRLTAAERDRCNSRFVEGLRSGLRVDAVPAAKRAYYDQVRDAYAKMHEGAPLPVALMGDGGAQVVAPAAHGAHLPGFGCSPALLGRKAPPRSLKLGPCVITPPSGFGTEEADVVPPPAAEAQRREAAAAAKSDPPSPNP